MWRLESFESDTVVCSTRVLRFSQKIMQYIAKKGNTMKDTIIVPLSTFELRNVVKWGMDHLDRPIPSYPPIPTEITFFSMFSEADIGRLYEAAKYIQNKSLQMGCCFEIQRRNDPKMVRGKRRKSWQFNRSIRQAIVHDNNVTTTAECHEKLILDILKVENERRANQNIISSNKQG